MQTIYFRNYLGPCRGFGSKERLYAPPGYHFLLKCRNIVFYSKMG